jgi:ComF family protein
MKTNRYMRSSITQFLRLPPWILARRLAKYAVIAWVFLLDAVLPRGEIAAQIDRLTATEALKELPRVGNIESTFAVFKYRHPIVRRLIWELKYRGNRRVAKLWGEILCEVLAQNSCGDRPLLIPVPLTRTRRRERGFNQNELVVREIIARDTGHAAAATFDFEFNALEKIRHTAPQSSLADRTARLKNLRGCFAVPEHRRDLVRDRNIILIDDVTTTGSTFAEARAALMQAGAQSVFAIALAH